MKPVAARERQHSAFINLPRRILILWWIRRVNNVPVSIVGYGELPRLDLLVGPQERRVLQ